MPPLGEHPHVGTGWGRSFPSILIAGHSPGGHLTAEKWVCEAKIFKMLLLVDNKKKHTNAKHIFRS